MLFRPQDAACQDVEFAGLAGQTGVWPASPTPAVSIEPQIPPTAGGKLLDVLDIAARVTESNQSWSRFAWRLTVRNNSDSARAFDATIEFQDRDGFIVDTDREYGLVIGPQAEETFTGSTLIDASVAGSVKRLVAKISGR
ncbi:MAG: hypothetical protein CL878_15010 [Dehalococcoidia bacterium]|nr:hypothetical protein [Dehalococcoidia bacterium]